MKERYAQQPTEGFIINVVESIAIIAFLENSRLVDTTEEGEIWEADKYVLTTPHRDNLSVDVDANYGVWLAAAKDAEINALAKEARKKRDELLTKSDKYTLSDYPVTDEQRALIMDYRRVLRDIPEQDGFPHEINWPEPAL